MTIPHTLCENSVTVFLDGNTYPVERSHPQYNAIIQALNNGDKQALRDVINVKQKIVNESSGRLEIVDGELAVQGTVISHSLVPRIIDMVEDGLDTMAEALANFVKNLLENPSFRAVNELHGFLEACKLPITGDGHFLAYKIVKENYHDCYTGKMDNSVGRVLSMPRNEVNEDSSVTCSHGLHVCSQDYLPYYGNGEGRRIMIVKVHPRDVVAVPNDYNNSKMRVCQYEVVDELPDEQARIRNNFTNEYSDVNESENDFDDDFFDEDEESNFEEVEVPTGTVNSSTLSYQNVWDIHSFLDDGLTLKAIGELMNISPRQVGRIRNGEAHGHVKKDYENATRNNNKYQR